LKNWLLLITGLNSSCPVNEVSWGYTARTRQLYIMNEAVCRTFNVQITQSQLFC